ncbi:tyrosine-type recombinase/integrase [Thiomonas sp.]
MDARGLVSAFIRIRRRGRELYEADCTAQGVKPDPSFLTDLRFHDLRHEATSRLFEKGLGIMEVASMTGHKSLAMLKRYTHVEAEKLAQKLG